MPLKKNILHLILAVWIILVIRDPMVFFLSIHSDFVKANPENSRIQYELKLSAVELPEFILADIQKADPDKDLSEIQAYHIPSLNHFKNEFPIYLKVKLYAYPNQSKAKLFVWRKSKSETILEFENGIFDNNILIEKNPAPEVIILALKDINKQTAHLYKISLGNGPFLITKYDVNIISYTSIFLIVFCFIILFIIQSYDRHSSLKKIYSTIIHYSTYIIIIPVCIFIQNLFIDLFFDHPYEINFSSIDLILSFAFWFIIVILIKNSYFFIINLENTFEYLSKIKFLLLLLLVFSLLFFTNINLAGDGAEYYAWIRSILWDHDLDFANESVTVLARGWRSGVYGILPFRVLTPLIWFPLFFFAYIVENIAYFFDLLKYNPGWTSVSITSVVTTSVSASIIGMLIIYNTLRIFFKSNISVLATFFAIIGTPVFTWIFVHPSYSHAIDW